MMAFLVRTENILHLAYFSPSKHTHPGSLLLDAHSSHWYLHTILPHRQTHGITMLRLPCTLLHICLCMKLHWQGTDKRQSCSLLASVQAAVHTLAHCSALTGLNGFPLRRTTDYNARPNSLGWIAELTRCARTARRWFLRLVRTASCYLAEQVIFHIFHSVTQSKLILIFFLLHFCSRHGTAGTSQSHLHCLLLGWVLIYHRRLAHALTNNSHQHFLSGFRCKGRKNALGFSLLNIIPLWSLVPLVPLRASVCVCVWLCTIAQVF